MALCKRCGVHIADGEIICKSCDQIIGDHTDEKLQTEAQSRRITESIKNNAASLLFLAAIIAFSAFALIDVVYWAINFGEWQHVLNVFLHSYLYDKTMFILNLFEYASTSGQFEVIGFQVTNAIVPALLFLIPRLLWILITVALWKVYTSGKNKKIGMRGFKLLKKITKGLFIFSVCIIIESATSRLFASSQLFEIADFGVYLIVLSILFFMKLKKSVDLIEDSANTGDFVHIIPKFIVIMCFVIAALKLVSGFVGVVDSIDVFHIIRNAVWSVSYVLFGFVIIKYNNEMKSF